MELAVWTTLGTGPAEDGITGLEFPVDLSMWPLMGQHNEKNNLNLEGDNEKYTKVESIYYVFLNQQFFYGKELQ